MPLTIGSDLAAPFLVLVIPSDALSPTSIMAWQLGIHHLLGLCGEAQIGPAVI
jgi:hypothetical protein